MAMETPILSNILFPCCPYRSASFLSLAPLRYVYSPAPCEQGRYSREVRGSMGGMAKIGEIVSLHGGFQSHRGTPSYHPFLDGIFSLLTIQRVPPWPWKLPLIHEFTLFKMASWPPRHGDLPLLPQKSGDWDRKLSRDSAHVEISWWYVLEIFLDLTKKTLIVTSQRMGIGFGILVPKGLNFYISQRSRIFPWTNLR